MNAKLIWRLMSWQVCR